MNITTMTTTCADCAKPFEFATPFTVPEMYPKRCAQCSAVRRAEIVLLKESEATTAAMVASERRWCEMCPPVFRDTDISRLHAGTAKAVSEWSASLAINLAIIGESGATKTRTAFVCLRAEHVKGLSCEAITHDEFARVARDSAFGDSCDKARARIEALRNCDVLLLDDVGKPPSTERADAELSALIDFRYAHMKPTIWTSNAGGAWLIARFGEDRGNPIVRRLAEGAMIVKL